MEGPHSNCRQIGIPRLHGIIHLLNERRDPHVATCWHLVHVYTSTRVSDRLRIIRNCSAEFLENIVGVVVQRLILVQVCVVDVIHGKLEALQLGPVKGIAISCEVGADGI